MQYVILKLGMLAEKRDHGGLMAIDGRPQCSYFTGSLGCAPVRASDKVRIHFWAKIQFE